MGIEKTFEIVEQINKANAYMRKERFMEAERVVDKLLKEAEQVEINKYGRVFDFSNNMEFVLYCHMSNKTNISWTKNFLSDIYILKGIILYEGRNFKSALEFFEKALKWNPVSIQTYNEILETCISLHDYDKFYTYFNRASQIAMRPIDLAILYKKLGSVCAERGKDEIAYNLLIYSKLFYPRKDVDLEINAIEERFGTRLKKYPDIGTIAYLEEKNLLYRRPDYIVPAYFTLIKSMQDLMKKEQNQTRMNYLNLIDYYNGLYFHRPGGQIHSALISLQREYAIKFPNKKE